MWNTVTLEQIRGAITQATAAGATHLIVASTRDSEGIRGITTVAVQPDQKVLGVAQTIGGPDFCCGGSCRDDRVDAIYRLDGDIELQLSAPKCFSY